MDFVQFLISNDIRPTANRLLILRVLAEAKSPLSLSELEDKLPTIDKSNIFRALTLFHTHHLVHALQTTNNLQSYELCLSHNDEHDDDVHCHFYCEQCHHTFCLDHVPIPPVALPDGFTSRTANYMLSGLCPKCSRKQISKPEE